MIAVIDSIRSPRYNWMMIKFAVIFILLISLVTAGSLAAIQKTVDSISETYQKCTGMAQTDPEQARQFAEEWVRRENNASAQHCHAIALFALKRYKDAATALERLSLMVTEKNPALWTNILRQSARAWSLNKDSKRAITVLSNAINKTAYPALSDATLGRIVGTLLAERSKIYMETGQDMMALQDLDQAVSLHADSEQALLLRAVIFINRREYDLATRDLHAVLTSSPGQTEALALMKRIDESGAAK